MHDLRSKKQRNVADCILTFLILLALVIALYLAPDSKAASVASCKGGVTWLTASHRIGRTVTLAGVPQGAKFVHWKSGAGTMTFLDFGGKYPHAKFTVVVWNKDVTRLVGHAVCLRGKVTLYNGQPELSVGD